MSTAFVTAMHGYELLLTASSTLSQFGRPINATQGIRIPQAAQSQNNNFVFVKPAFAYIKSVLDVAAATKRQQLHSTPAAKLDAVHATVTVQRTFQQKNTLN